MSEIINFIKNSTKPYPLDIVFADELSDTFAPPDEIIEDVITAGAGSILYGDSNSGKTFLVIDMACSIALGRKWLGKHTEPGMVIYLAAESPASVQMRLQAYQRHYGVKAPNFVIVKNPIDLFAGDGDTCKIVKLFAFGLTAKLFSLTLKRIAMDMNTAIEPILAIVMGILILLVPRFLNLKFPSYFARDV